MPTVNPSSVPMPRGMLGWDGANFYCVSTDANGRLQIDVVGSALPAGAATAANQVIVNTTLELIALLRNALQTVATDRLIVRGEDQQFSFRGVLADSITGAISGADGFLDGPAVPAGQYWVVTTIAARDATNAVTRIILANRHDGVNYDIEDVVRAFGAGERAIWSGHTYLDSGDYIRATFIGGQAADTCLVTVTGYRMTVEV